MSDAPGGGDQSAADSVDFTMTIEDGRTRIRVTGDRDTAVVVESDSGEKIYLPPEDFDRSAGGGRTSYDSPYDSGSGAQDSPYQTSTDAASVTGLEPTANGYLIIHPEPVTDVRFLR
jgi:hypothetical protein